MVNKQKNKNLYHGLTTCEGCGMELIARNVIDILGENTVMITPPSCSAILTGFSRATGWPVPSFMSNLESVAAYASGIREGYEITGKKDIHVVGFAGDGGTADIGLQALSGAIERGHRFIYICYDNEAYMNTGIQRSGCTPIGAWTTTTPNGKPTIKKDISKMILAQGIPYMATASIAFIEDMRKKIEKAKEIDGPSFLHIHIPCSTGWRFPPCKTIEVAKLAVETGMWNLYEAEEGKVRLTKKVKEFKPVKDYMKMQKRFDGISDELVKVLENEAAKNYQELLEMEGK